MPSKNTSDSVSATDSVRLALAYVWPASLPQYMELGEDETWPLPLVIKSSIDIGRAKLRLRSTALTKVIKGVVSMTAAQVATFDVFYITTLKYGTRKFNWKHPRTGDVVAYYFAATPTYASETDVKNQYRIALELEILS